MKAAERGFSLVEVLATLAVMALVIGMVASSVTASLTAGSRVSDDPNKALRRVMSLLQSAVTAPASAGGLARIAPLYGDERRLHFVTVSEDDGGLAANRFLSSDEGLIWDRKPVRHEREIVEAIYPIAETVTVPQLTGLRFSYRKTGQNGWRLDWPAGPTAPDLVRVQIVGNGGRILSGVVRTGAVR